MFNYSNSNRGFGGTAATAAARTTTTTAAGAAIVEEGDGNDDGEIESELNDDERRIFESISEDLRLLSLNESSPQLLSFATQQEIMNRVSSKLSILAQNGRGQVLIDAFSDGSSLFCPFCGQLISLKRFLCHRNFWCPALIENHTQANNNDVEM